MRYAEGLADRQAAAALRGRTDWKYCLGPELTDSGSDAPCDKSTKDHRMSDALSC
ncbi:hypothetical protein ACWC3X_36580 [Streptomyces populi]